MPTYLSLFVWTEQGVHDVINTGKRAADFRSRIQAAGGAVKDIFRQQNSPANGAILLGINRLRWLKAGHSYSGCSSRIRKNTGKRGMPFLVNP